MDSGCERHYIQDNTHAIPGRLTWMKHTLSLIVWLPLPETLERLSGSKISIAGSTDLVSCSPVLRTRVQRFCTADKERKQERLKQITPAAVENSNIEGVTVYTTA